MDSSNYRAGSATGFQYKLALILVEQGESREAAWARHLNTYPEALWAPIRIFHYSATNHPPPKWGLTGSQTPKKHHHD
ncbi:MAG: hypothetical protein PHW74_00585 [Desulfobacca sp.]|nr:hypothetical protein [Desulfobacca sp.]